jgi:hypothetical protein
MSGFDDNGSIKRFENEISNTIKGLEGDIPSKLANLAASIESQLKSGNFKDRTGNLRRSIQVGIIDNNISIGMPAYGYYLSFGVNGKNRNNALGLPPEVASAFGVPEGYKFGSSKVWGIDARKFYPLNVEEQLLDILTRTTDL